MNAVAESLPMRVRLMRDEDISSVIENEEAAYAHPWTTGIMRDCLKVGYHCVVGQVGERVMAHGIMSVAAGESHVLNLCVHPGWQGHGYGRCLLEHLMGIALNRGASHTFLEVRASNEAAQKLYLSLGFNEIAQRPDYYPAARGREMALIFAKTLGEPEQGA